MKKYILALIMSAMIFAGCDRQQPSPPSVSGTMERYNRELAVGGKNIFVEIVTTPQQMARGLSVRQQLTDKQGMLFDFGRGANVTPRFWMKDMNFDLDIIWIKDNKVIGITPDVPAPAKDKGSTIKDNNLPTYTPPSPVDAVLEVNAGWTDKNKIKIGDEVRLVNNQ